MPLTIDAIYLIISTMAQQPEYPDDSLMPPGDRATYDALFAMHQRCEYGDAATLAYMVLNGTDVHPDLYYLAQVIYNDQNVQQAMLGNADT